MIYLTTQGRNGSLASLTPFDLAKIDRVSPATSNAAEAALGTTSSLLTEDVTPSLAFLAAAAKVREFMRSH